MSKLEIYLYLTGFAMCAIMWSIAIFILVLVARDIVKQKD